MLYAQTDGWMDGWRRKFPICECIGHRPLRGRCPSFPSDIKKNVSAGATGTADHVTLLRLFPLFSTPPSILPFFPFWAADLKGTKSCRTQGEFLSVRPSIRTCVPPPCEGLGLGGLGLGLLKGFLGLLKGFLGLLKGFLGLLRAS